MGKNPMRVAGPQAVRFKPGKEKERNKKRNGGKTADREPRESERGKKRRS